MFKWILFLFVLVSLVVLGLYIGFANSQLAEVNLLFMKVNTSVASIVAGSFASGFVVALILSTVVRVFRACFSFLTGKNSKKNSSSVKGDIPAADGDRKAETHAPVSE